MLIAIVIFLLVIFTISEAGPYGVSIAQKTQDQLWNEQHYGIVMGCRATNIAKEFEGATGQSTEESDKNLEICNHDILYMLGICEQNNDGYTFCDSVHTYIDDNNLDQISERPEQLSQETIDKINEHDWNEDGVTDGADFVSEPSTQ